MFIVYKTLGSKLDAIISKCLFLRGNSLHTEIIQTCEIAVGFQVSYSFNKEIEKDVFDLGVHLVHFWLLFRSSLIFQN